MRFDIYGLGADGGRRRWLEKGSYEDERGEQRLKCTF
jgi:hypothetical protein